MSKRTNVVAVVAFAVVAGADFGMQSFGETPVTTRVAESPVRDLFAAALVRDGYPPALAGLVSAQIEEVSAGKNQHHYVQSLGGGGRRELTTSVSPVVNYVHSKAEQLVTLEDGTPLYVTRRNVKTSAGGYEINLQFYVPSDKLSHELKQALGVETAPPITSNPTLLDRFLALLGVQSAFAVEPPAFGPPGGFVSNVSDAFVTGGTVVGQGPPPAPGAGGNVVVVEGAGVEMTRDLKEYFVETQSFVENASQMHGERRVLEQAEKLQAELRAKQAIKAMEEAEREAIGGAAHVALTGLEVWTITQENEEILRRLKELLDCAEHPTNPLTIRAMKQDPNYNRSTIDVIKAAISEVQRINSGRVAITSLNAGIGARAGPAGALGMGFITHVENHILQDTIEKYVLGDVAKGVVPCRKCGAGAATAAARDAELNYTPGSGLNYTPGHSIPGPNACKPIHEVLFKYHYASASDGCVAGVLCGTSSASRAYFGSASVKFVKDNGNDSGFTNDGYDGKGAGSYVEIKDSHTKGFQGCPGGASSHSETRGPAALVVHAQFSVENTVTGGIDTSKHDADTSVVEFLVDGGHLAIAEETRECGEDKSSNSNEISAGFDCHFYGVDLVNGGTYSTFKDGDPAEGRCEMTIF